MQIGHCCSCKVYFRCFIHLHKHIQPSFCTCGQQVLKQPDFLHLLYLYPFIFQSWVCFFFPSLGESHLFFLLSLFQTPLLGVSVSSLFALYLGGFQERACLSIFVLGFQIVCPINLQYLLLSFRWYFRSWNICTELGGWPYVQPSSFLIQDWDRPRRS